MVRLISIVMLLATGFAACVGGLVLISDPSGNSMGLKDTVFTYPLFVDYGAPGFLLFVLIGLLSLVAGVLVVKEVKNYPMAISAQGAVITIWILVQFCLISSTHVLQFVFLVVGILLIIAGSLLRSGRLL